MNPSLTIKDQNIKEIINEFYQNNLNSVKSTDYQVKAVYQLKENVTHGNFVIAHKDEKDDFNSLSVYSKVKKEVDLIKSVKLILYLTILFIIIHDSYQYYNRYKIDKIIDTNFCKNNYYANNCKNVLENIEASPPYLVETCYEIDLCIRKNYFTISYFLIDKLSLLFSVNWLSLDLGIINETMIIVFTIGLSILVIVVI